MTIKDNLNKVFILTIALGIFVGFAFSAYNLYISAKDLFFHRDTSSFKDILSFAFWLMSTAIYGYIIYPSVKSRH